MGDLIGPILEFVSEPVQEWLEKEVIHLIEYKDRVKKLEEDVKKLKEKREQIENKVDEEENRYDRKIPPEVKGWLKDVDEAISKYEKFVDGDQRYQEVARICFLPKLRIRYRRSKIAYDIINEVNELHGRTDKLDTLSYLLVPPSLTALLHNVGYVSFKSREEIIGKINAALEDPSVRIIGLLGWSGVGKTTLVKEIARKALQASGANPKMFDTVAMANVTRNPDIRKIQGQIADMLGMTLDDESDIARAARIRKRLMSAKENTLIILDDLWETLDFNMLGIPLVSDVDADTDADADAEHNLAKPPVAKEVPFETENVKKEKARGEQGMAMIEKYDHDMNMKKFEKLPNVAASSMEALSRYKGCNVLLISEMKEVLLSQMEGNEKSIYFLDVLEEKEAEKLFKKKAGIDSGSGTNSKIEKLAVQIANKCHGLPMTIVTTARALKNQSHGVWDDVRRQLENNKSIAAPEFSTRLSYNHLENEELKDTFLLCARMGPDAFIMDLVKYCIGLGFLRGIYTVRETRSKIYALVARLKMFGLLSDSYSRDLFTMPDIVRRSALSIASKEEHVLTMIKENIDEWPDEDQLERYTTISLHHCDIIKGFPSSINCPKLRVFHVNNNDLGLKIPEKLFEGMKELRVLILTGFSFKIPSFPSSIRFLSKLRMLCLEQCELAHELSIIGELTNLRILSLSGSDIENLPSQLNHLTMLQILDISNCSKLRGIPFNVISRLIRLEELYMRNTLIQWKVEGQKNASLSELKHLNQLTSLDMQIQDVSCLVDNLFFDKLSNYNIVVGELDTYLEMDFKMPDKYEASRFLAIQFKNGFDIHNQRGIKMLFGSVETLFLEDLNGVKDIFYTLNLKGFPHLKHLLIVNDSDIQFLINPKDKLHKEKAFPKLESLFLYNLKKMEKICSYELSIPSFGSLKVIKINLCGQLKHVFLFSIVSLLTALETLEVSECNALLKIVNMEEHDTKEIKLQFPKLLSLTLQFLSEFIGFHSSSKEEKYSSSKEETTPLFHERVEVSKLERMVVSSIKIDKIWSDQPSNRSCRFQNLIHLDVNDCWNLKYLISVSMAQSLEKLQSLFVSDCEKMEHIFQPGQGSFDKIKGSIFPSLKNIKLSSMKSLSEIWKLDEFPLDSFGKLDTLIMEECDKLVNVFPSSTVGVLRSLCNLRVTNCRLMKAIFELDDKKRNDWDVTKLKDVHLETLPKLDHVWKLKKERDGILEIANLQKICVKDCDSLQNIFPSSISMCFNNLEYLVVSNCLGLREFVAKRDGTNINPSPSFEFPKLTTIKFSELPKLESFYAGACTLSFPALNDMCIEHCYKLERFMKGTTKDEQRNPLFTIEVINQLKSMQIESWHTMSPTSYLVKGNYRMVNLEELCLFRLRNTEIPYSFLHSNAYLKSLSLNNCSFAELVPPKMPPEFKEYGVVPELKSLNLTDLPNLETIGFERDVILQRIEFLIVKNCPSLLNIVPSSVSLTRLTTLEVINCNGLENLMSPSAAKSLVQLGTMRVIKCESLEEIVGNEEQNPEKKLIVVFRQLKVLELVSLNNLNSFCMSKSCVVFEFPSLEKLVVSACPKMETFSAKVKSTISLQKIYVVPHEQEKRRSWYWKGDLNATVREMFKEKRYFEGMEEIKVFEHPDLQQTWHDKVQSRWFYNLKTLKLYKCTSHPYAIPSNIFSCLKSLKELEVRECKQVRLIFEMNDTEIMETSFQLKILTLEGLPELTHVWDKGCKGIPRFQNLQHVSVKDCNNLQTLFPAALAKKLKKLVKLEISLCKDIQAIVGKEENTTTEKFVFPHLTLLYLFFLLELTCFYPGTFTLECPMLNKLFVVDCYKLELFQSAHQEIKSEGSSSTSINRQPVFLDLRAIPNLEDLHLDWKHISKLRSIKLTENLEHLHEINLYFDVDKNEKPLLPIEILEKAPNLEHMSVKFCNSIQTFLTQSPATVNEFMKSGNLKSLTLFKVSKLQCVGLADSSWLNIACEKLHKLTLNNCPDLSKLLHPTSAVSFFNLKELCVTQCHGLEYLFSFSTAEKFNHLEKIEIKDCNSMKNIVTTEGSETRSQEIKFEWLDKITLNSLSSLDCFYSGNGTLQLPSLAQLNIFQCPNMEIFSKGSTHTKYFRGIQASSDPNDELVFDLDLNSSVKRVIQLQNSPKDIISFYKHIDLQQAGKDGVGLQHNWFCSLKTLKLENCDIHPYAMPYNVLCYLRSLQELEVLNCDQVKVIFYMNGTGIMETTCKLKILILEGLPKLTHVWDKNHVGIVRFQNLQQVTVKDCKILHNMFPIVLAKSLKKMEKIKIKLCPQMKEIVEKREDDTIEMPEKFVFPRLSKFHLYNLKMLNYFYPETFTLECPLLNKLQVIECPKLELFQSVHHKVEGEGSGEGSNNTSINRQPLFSNLNAVSNLEALALDGKHMPGLRSAKLTEELNFLQKIRLLLDVDDIEELSLPYEILEKAPNLYQMSIEWCISIKIFLTQNPKFNVQKMLGHLKILTLYKVSELQSIGFADSSSWLNIVCEKLGRLNVDECSHLSTLVHSTCAISFTNLKELVIFECHALKNLFTSSTAKKFMRLEWISLKNCRSLKAIVAKDEDEEVSEGIKFEWLRSIHLESLSNLECFYLGNETLRLPSLQRLDLLQCPEMKFFSKGSTHTKYFRGIQTSSNFTDDFFFCNDLNTSVEMLFLQQPKEHLVFGDNSPLLKAIWLNSEIDPHSWFFRNLNSLVMEGCDFLSNVTLPSHILPLLNNLKKLEVRKCNSVKAIFVHTKIGLQGSHHGLPCLENLKVESCAELVEIVAKDETTTEEPNLFPHISSLVLTDLPKLRCIYPEMPVQEWPELKILDFQHCPMMKFFEIPDSHLEYQHSLSRDQLAAVSLKKVTPHLEELSLGVEEANMIEQGKLHVDLQNLNRLVLQGFNDDSHVLPFVFRSKKLKAASLSTVRRLVLCHSAFKEIFPSQSPDLIEDYSEIFSHLQLQNLVLVNLPRLESIGFENYWIHPFLDKLDFLVVVDCNCLTNLSPSTVSFSNMTQIKVKDCEGLKYLFTYSTAKTLHALEWMTVTNCGSLHNVVVKDDDNEGHSKDDDIITFHKLQHLILSSLTNLESFYSGSSALNFSSLEEVTLTKCSTTKIFFVGDSVPKELKVTIDEILWEGDINSAIMKQDLLVLRDSPMLKAIWLKSEINPHRFFHNLNSLVMEGCDFLSNVILPSHILPHLSNLKKLEVRKCNSVKAIFVHTKMEPQGSHHSLPCLEKLKVESCEELVEIVAKDETTTEEVNEELNLFPNITSLKLINLPNLRCIYPELPVQEWSVLKKLYVTCCPMMKFFTTKFQNSQDSQLQYCPTDQQPIVSLKKVTPLLEKLSLGVEEANMITQGKLHVDLQNLNELTLLCFNDEDSHVFPFVFHSKKAASLPTIRRLVLRDSAFKVIFPSQSPETQDYSKIFSHLEQLMIQQLSRLESIGLENHWIRPFLDKLDFLAVVDCNCLTNLSPSTVSFSNMTQIKVEDCEGLKYLFTSSTAKTLCALERMFITNCESLQNVVVTDDDDDEGHNKDDDIITFHKLQYLTLGPLPNLESFYSGSSALSFSSLEKVTFTKCSTAKIFRLGDSVPKELKVTIDEILWKGDINSAIMKQDLVVLGDSPLLKAIWLNSEIDPHSWFFRNLNSLVMEGCDFLSNVILPSHILPLLSNLKKLEVGKCNFVKAIFVHTKTGLQGSHHSLPCLENLKVESCAELVEIVAKDETTTEEAIEELILFPNVTSLELNYLPKLRCIYPEMPVQEWPVLKELDVYYCPMMKFFTTKFQNSEDSHLQYSPTDQQSIVSLKKVTPLLEKLSLSVEEANMIEQGKLHVDLQNLNELTLQCFDDDSHVFPFVFHSKKVASLPTIKKLVIRHSAFKEIFRSESLDTQHYSEIFSHLEDLVITNLSRLESIGFENYWIHPFLDKLDFLAVVNCDCLTNLSPSTVSFSNMTEIRVKYCKGLKYLFTSSTAKTLRALEWFTVTNCGSLQNVVVTGDDEGHTDDIITFNKLKHLTLGPLPNLESFYSGSSALNFSSLEEVTFTECSPAKIFRLGDSVPKELKVTIDGTLWEGDINSAIMKQIEEENQPQEIVA